MGKRLGAALTAILITFSCVAAGTSIVHAGGYGTQPGPDGIIYNAVGDEEEETSPELGELTPGIADSGKENEATPEPENGQTRALQAPVAAQQPEQYPVIVVFAVTLDFPNDAYFLEASGDAKTLALEETAYAQHGRFDFEPCKIVWRYDEFDNMTPGRRMIVGDIELPPGFAFESEPIIVQSPVIVYDPDGVPTEQIATCVYTYSGQDETIIIPLGAGWETLPGYFTHIWSEALLTTASGDEFFCPLTLNFDVIDIGREGVYYPIVIDLPGGVTFGGQEFFMTGVHVMPDDKVGLSAVKWWRNGYSVKWLYPASEPVLWASVDGEDWFLPETWAEGARNTYGYFQAAGGNGFDGMVLTYNNLIAGHIYQFQVQYDGDRFSNVLELDLITGSLPKTYSDNGGDRTGGDRGVNTLPPTVGTTPPPDNGTTPPYNGTATTPDNSITTTPPSTGGATITPPASGDTPDQPEIHTGDPVITPPPANSVTREPTITAAPGTETPAPVQAGNGDTEAASPTAQPQSSEQPAAQEPVVIQKSVPTQKPVHAEYSDDKSVTVSGSWLQAMAAANPSYVTFLPGEMRISVPSAFLDSLKLNRTDTFTVILYRADDSSFLIDFDVNGEQLDYSNDNAFRVNMTWINGAVSCTDENGASVEGEIDSTGQSVTFSLHKTGIYKLLLPDEETVPVMAEASQPPDGITDSGTTPLNPEEAAIGKQPEVSETTDPYKDSAMPIAAVSGLSLAAAVGFAFFTRRKAAKI